MSGEEALGMGLVDRLVEPGEAFDVALELANSIAAFPQRCLRSDRRSALTQWNRDLDEALAEETRLGLEVIRSGETREGAIRFAGGAGRHGRFD